MSWCGILGIMLNNQLCVMPLLFSTRVSTSANADTLMHGVSVVAFGPCHRDWIALFMSSIGFPLGGQTELMLQGVRVGNLRQLANQ